MYRAVMVLFIAFYFVTPHFLPPVLAQEDSESYIALDKMPEIVGGWASLQQAVKYPKSALKDSVEGIVYVKVKIAADGQLAEIKIDKGVRKDLDDAALEAVRSLKWKPGEAKGQPIECWIVAPISFKMQDKKK